jgi:hypothetical protein
MNRRETLIALIAGMSGGATNEISAKTTEKKMVCIGWVAKGKHRNGSEWYHVYSGDKYECGDEESARRHAAAHFNERDFVTEVFPVYREV